MKKKPVAKEKSGYIDPNKVLSKTQCAKTLKVVNRLLTKNGAKSIKKLPPGIPMSSCLCPVTIALKPLGIVEVDPFDMTGECPVWYQSKPIFFDLETPTVIAEFIRKFDARAPKEGDDENY